MPAVLHALQISNDQMGVERSIQSLLRVNQKDGFDCPGCAWPEEDKRHIAEFCENGAKAVAEEATIRRVGPEFFAEHSLAELEAHDDWWLGQQGRLTHPMILDEGATHYRPISWDDALREIADALRGLDDPDEAIFYTSGRTSNEAAFLYQLLVRGFGTNNLPDCSNMCHESSGSALTETIGIGKGTVSIEDIHEADLLIVAGQNPGTNHPRMLSRAREGEERRRDDHRGEPAARGRARCGSRTRRPSKGVILGGTKLADQFVQIRLGGDQALFQAIGKHLLEVEAARRRRARPRLHRRAHERLRRVPRRDGGGAVARAGRGDRTAREDAAPRGRGGARRRRRRSCAGRWGSRSTSTRCATLRDVVNVLLLQGNIGRPGAGVCPVRGHSNVQGDRTMGIYEKPSEAFLDALDREFEFTAPREHGHDTVAAIRAMRDGTARVFMGMGGNFVWRPPTRVVTEAALRNVDLTVQVSTKLNRSHVVTGRRAIILPTLGRTDRDRRGGGEQRVTVEDSMGAVHASRGRLVPPSEDLLSEVAIVARLCALLFGTDAGDRPGPEIDVDTAVEVDFGQPEHDGIQSDAPAVERTHPRRPTPSTAARHPRIAPAGGLGGARARLRADPPAHRGGHPGLRGLRGSRSTRAARCSCRTARATSGASRPSTARRGSR